MEASINTALDKRIKPNLSKDRDGKSRVLASFGKPWKTP